MTIKELGSVILTRQDEILNELSASNDKNIQEAVNEIIKYRNLLKIGKDDETEIAISLVKKADHLESIEYDKGHEGLSDAYNTISRKINVITEIWENNGIENANAKYISYSSSLK